MIKTKLTSTVAALCFYGLAAPAMAGSFGHPQVIPGIGPDPRLAAQQDYDPAQGPADRPGRYGGGFIEFMMTGHSTPSPVMAPRPMPQRAYMANAGGSQEPDYGVEPGYQPQPGYEYPRKPVDPMYQRQEVAFEGRQGPGTIVIDTTNKFLYLVEGEGRALRYGIGVGRPGFLWSGEKTISRKAEWPEWTPPAEMVKRRPDLPSHMEGGIANPLGARAMYLGSSLYRIHGTNEPDTIGTNVSSGCIRLTNDDVADLYGRVKVGTKVLVM